MTEGMNQAVARLLADLNQPGTPVERQAEIVRSLLALPAHRADALIQVQELLGQIGWNDMVDVGDIRQSRLLEAFMMTCLFTEFATKARGGAFAFLRT